VGPQNYAWLAQWWEKIDKHIAIMYTCGIIREIP